MKKILTAVFVVVLIFALYFYFGRNYFLSKKPSKSQGYNLLLITIDTLRADRLGCYGFEKNTSPSIDKFSEESLLFENAVVQTPFTGPSHSSIFTGKYLANHGVLSNGYILTDDNVALAEVLKKNGYTTGAFIASYVLKKDYNYNQGFDVYSGGEVSERRADEVTNDLLQWIEKNKKEKFFAWAHFYDAHCPYFPPEEFRDRFRGQYKGDFDTDKKCGKTQYNKIELSGDDVEYVKSMYEAEIAYVDSNMKQIFEALAEWGLKENTVIVITSDHGESLYEKGLFGHNLCLYDYEIKIPLIIHYPGMKRRGEREVKQVQSVSIMPTLLDMLNIDFPEKIDGKSFYSLFTENKGGDDIAYSRIALETDIDKLPEYSLRTDKWKLIADENGNRELFDILTDPGESVNLSEDTEVITETAKLSESIKAIIRKEKEQTSKKVQNMSDKTISDLKTLGYIR